MIFRACLIINVADRVVWLEMVFDMRDEGVYFMYTTEGQGEKAAETYGTNGNFIITQSLVGF